MRAALIPFAIFLFGGCSEEISGDSVEQVQAIDVDALVESAVMKCAIESADADPNQVPGANEVCLARMANAAPLEARASICSEAKAWAGYMDKDTCYIDPE